jgi:hypothetical protein
MLVLLIGLASAAANKPSGPDSSPAAKPSNVKNAPFSADVITQYDRALDKGAHIHRESRGKVYRDSQGRMRTESEASTVQSGSDKSERITINDPLQQIIIYLNPRNKTATILHFGDVGPTAVAKQKKPKEKSKISVGREDPGIGPDNIGVPPVPSGQANAPSNTSIPTPGAATSSMEATIFSNNSGATIVPLGTKNIEGVSATGTRTTRTINAGTMGNDRPIVSICDTWVSSDLKVTVLTETDDGQAGRSTMKLVNIVRSEPSAALFQVPADYTVTENASTTSAKR